LGLLYYAKIPTANNKIAPRAPPTLVCPAPLLGTYVGAAEGVATMTGTIVTTLVTVSTRAPPFLGVAGLLGAGGLLGLLEPFGLLGLLGLVLMEGYPKMLLAVPQLVQGV
jgi:hypothetical protein